MPALYVGVDGGGTRTRAVVAGEDLVVRGRGTAGPSNASRGSLAHVMEVIHEAIDDALEGAGIGQGDVHGICCGVAGVDASGMKDRLQWSLEKIFGFGLIQVTTDARIALAGAGEGPVDAPGIILIAGTGAIAFGRNAKGEEARAGGWGPLLGDEGSGYAIAREGLMAVVRYLDQRGPDTLLRTTVLSSEGIGTTAELLHRIHRPDGGAAEVAAFFPMVLDAARQGDPISLEIFRRAGAELGLAVVTVARKLGMLEIGFRVATVGGVFAAGPVILAPIREILEPLAPKATVEPAAYPPEIGAVRIALAGDAAGGRA
jgi:N-acetylglucosamine kinase-like BadF-type ATPase